MCGLGIVVILIILGVGTIFGLGGIWIKSILNDTQFVKFNYGNGKRTNLWVDPDDKFKLLKPLFREKMNLSSTYAVDFYYGGLLTFFINN